MALPLNSPRIANALRRWAGLRGAFGLNLLEDVFPSVIVGDPERPEFALDFNIRNFSIFNLVPAVAGQYGLVQIQNAFPSDSPHLVVVDRVGIKCAVSASFYREEPTSKPGVYASPTHTGAGWDDERIYTGAGGSVSILHVVGLAGSDVAVTPAGYTRVHCEGTTVVNSTSFFQSSLRTVLPPYGLVQFNCDVLNTAWECSVSGYTVEVSPEEALLR